MSKGMFIAKLWIAVAPHASFRHPDCPEVFQPRESIEVRALVFTYPKTEP
jgi:hypothetical protein